MGKASKILDAAKANKAGVAFSDLQKLAEAAGWVLKRSRGSHHMYSRPGTPELINLQADGSKAKKYQVEQVLDLIEKYKIEIP